MKHSEKKDCFRCVFMEHYSKLRLNQEESEQHLYICTVTQPDEEDGIVLLKEISGFNPCHCLDFKEVI